MKPLPKGFFLGGLLGVLAIVLGRLFHVVSPALKALLVPGAFITAPYQGQSPWTTGIFVGMLEFVMNFAIYGLAGLAIAWLTVSAGTRSR